jgi:hypothetical protein
LPLRALYCLLKLKTKTRQITTSAARSLPRKDTWLH